MSSTRKEPEINEYKLTEEELEKYRKLKPPTDSQGKPIKRSVGFYTGGYRQ